MTFAVTHAGRGGWVRCELADGQLELPIDLVGGGQFCVHLRGAAVRGARRDELRRRLRAWLDETDRAGWVIEG